MSLAASSAVPKYFKSLEIEIYFASAIGNEIIWTVIGDGKEIKRAVEALHREGCFFEYAADRQELILKIIGEVFETFFQNVQTVLKGKCRLVKPGTEHEIQISYPNKYNKKVETLAQEYLPPKPLFSRLEGVVTIHLPSEPPPKPPRDWL